MSSRRYLKIEELPYPRATHVGHLTDRAGVPLHGAYQREFAGGFRAAIINNGTVRHRYSYSWPVSRSSCRPTHSFSNLVHTLGPWMVGDEAERPVTNYPASEYPRAGWRPLWSEPLILGSLLRGRKPAGTVYGTPDIVEEWTSIARTHGLTVRTDRSWVNGLGQAQSSVLVARPGPVASDEDLEWLAEQYDEQLPWLSVRTALYLLRHMQGENLSATHLANPRSADDLIISGYCFGYPPATTAACITGTHG